MAEHRLDAEGIDALALTGVNDCHLREINRRLGLRVVLRGDAVVLSGEETAVRVALPVVRSLIDRAKQRRPFGEAYVSELLSRALTENDGNQVSGRRGSDGSVAGAAREGSGSSRYGDPAGKGGNDDLRIALPGSRRVIAPKSAGQRKYVRAILSQEVVIGIGPAGTGKTYLAVACAVDALARRRVRRIVLARPAVEAGESLGFLPGDLQEKVDPYLRPLYDALGDMLPRDRIARAIEDSTIEIAPLAYMRGRTLGDAFVILDEAQNATTVQMKMFLTRLGVNSRVVITGDKTQIDLARPSDSGLLEVERILADVAGIALVHLDPRDVVRHRLVKDILRAYSMDGSESGDSK